MATIYCCKSMRSTIALLWTDTSCTGTPLTLVACESLNATVLLFVASCGQDAYPHPCLSCSVCTSSPPKSHFRRLATPLPAAMIHRYVITALALCRTSFRLLRSTSAQSSTPLTTSTKSCRATASLTDWVSCRSSSATTSACSRHVLWHGWGNKASRLFWAQKITASLRPRWLALGDCLWSLTWVHWRKE